MQSSFRPMYQIIRELKHKDLEDSVEQPEQVEMSSFKMSSVASPQGEVSSTQAYQSQVLTGLGSPNPNEIPTWALKKIVPLPKREESIVQEQVATKAQAPAKSENKQL